MIARLPNHNYYEDSGVWKSISDAFVFFEGGNVLRILIADDSKFMRRLIRLSIELLGHTVVAEASDGIEAVDAYKEKHPDIVFIDMIMPNMNGLEAIEHILLYDSDARIVMCSSMGHASYIREAIVKGARDFIVKPFRPGKVAEVLAKFN